MMTDQHAVPQVSRPPGPVTGAIRIASARQPKALRLSLRIWPAVPALALIRPAIHGSPRLGDYASQVLGTDAMICLLACLAVSPLVAVTPARAQALRRWYGVWTFVIGLAGLGITVTQPGPGSMMAKAAGTSVNWTGMLIVVLLLPMAATSNLASMKLLGPEWKHWQRALIWAVWWLVLVHLTALKAWPFLIGFGAASLPLIVLRRTRFRKRVKTWRSGGYSTGGMWVVLDVLGCCFAAGMTILLTEQVITVVRAAALSPVA